MPLDRPFSGVGSIARLEEIRAEEVDRQKEQRRREFEEQQLKLEKQRLTELRKKDREIVLEVLSDREKNLVTIFNNSREDDESILEINKDSIDVIVKESFNYDTAWDFVNALTNLTKAYIRTNYDSSKINDDFINEIVVGHYRNKEVIPGEIILRSGSAQKLVSYSREVKK